MSTYEERVRDGVRPIDIAAEADATVAKLRAEIEHERGETRKWMAHHASAMSELASLQAKLEKPRCRCTGWNITPPEVCDSFTPWDEDEDCAVCSHELGCHSSVAQELAPLRAKVAAGEECAKAVAEWRLYLLSEAVGLEQGGEYGIPQPKHILERCLGRASVTLSAARAAGLGGDVA